MQVEPPDHALFQSTPPRGRRQVIGHSVCQKVRFQSTPPRGRRPCGCGELLNVMPVSIHASTREATISRSHSAGQWEFQSTPPRGRRRLTAGIIAFRTGFNPRLHEGGDDWGRYGRYIGFVFQSTPPRGRRHPLLPDPL